MSAEFDAQEGSEDGTGDPRTQRAKIFGPAKPLRLRAAIAGPCDEPRSCHNAGARG